MSEKASEKASVFFVGGGAYDPDQLTVRAAHALGIADVVIHDKGAARDVLSIAASAEKIPALGDASADAARAIEAARAGKVVARLFEGDALLFASGEVEARAVGDAGIAFEIVPAVTLLAKLGTHGALALTRAGDATPAVAWAHVEQSTLSAHDWSRMARATDTLVVTGDAAALGEVARSLVFEGRPEATPAALASCVGMPTQRIAMGTLEDAEARASQLAAEGRAGVLVVGESIARREALRWFDRGPLFGKRVLVLRASEQSSATSELLRARGAAPIAVPMIALHAPQDPEPLARAVAALPSGYAWALFTSANGVAFTWRVIEEQGRDARVFGGVRVAAIGPATAAELRARGIKADVTAKEFRGEGLADAILEASGQARGRVLLARAKEAREVLPERLVDAGFVVDVVTAYETHPAEGDAEALALRLTRGDFDAVLFTSSSTVTRLCARLGPKAPELLALTKVASIGPITTDTARRNGLRVDVTATTYTLPGLVDAVESAF